MTILTPKPWQTHAERIAHAFSQRHQLDRKELFQMVDGHITEVISALDKGELRVAEAIDDEWHTHAWIKEAILLYFMLSPNQMFEGAYTRYYDKVPSKYAQHDADTFQQEGVRVVPQAMVRHGAYVAPGCVLMPSYTNVGAYIDSGTMIDTWATVGSCAQIGKNVHLSGGAGIGGVLEPIQATPTIIEDNCFIGARAEVAEGVIVRQGAVLASGLFITGSTKIYDRETGEITCGEVPSNAVVVPGSLPAEDGSHSVAAAIIVKRVDENTRAKTSINELLRPGS